jgi:hypothetical protein
MIFSLANSSAIELSNSLYSSDENKSNQLRDWIGS